MSRKIGFRVNSTHDGNPIGSAMSLTYSGNTGSDGFVGYGLTHIGTIYEMIPSSSDSILISTIQAGTHTGVSTLGRIKNITLFKSDTNDSTTNWVELITVDLNISGTNYITSVNGLAINLFWNYPPPNIIPNFWTNLNNVTAKYVSNALYLGKEYAGGIIVYIDSSGVHGLVCTIDEYFPGVLHYATWNNGSYTFTGTSSEIYAGQANTSSIVTYQGTGYYAAKRCDNLTLNGYSDWYLPSKDELNLFYVATQNISFDIPVTWDSSSIYWSSSDNSDISNAWAIDMSDGSMSLINKSSNIAIRPFRRF